jgi:hypothetical protein
MLGIISLYDRVIRTSDDAASAPRAATAKGGEAALLPWLFL